MTRGTDSAASPMVHLQPPIPDPGTDGLPHLGRAS